ncbi:D-isomer specific 2-hydroxyacid dehydrogenase, NAD-binding [Syntrophomonas zehnderi OL-4]|uniref:D-isomer specific 2-hydroxyacid dehydrogenase, NAD-binding n=1 Tax=Syntrophomonas zehnderi OL-4 TaxID=690567 RepID=A0A0E4GB17_9FIRM|nr:dipicolinate synthase subunit DpsA [Syntrophomonas zehnderi]CFX75653.1 D-isomer specific 2-hydroxyacid dehydrogenase, NAD-binding [Syntrophomonas zehnderi OL-4]
MSSVLSGTKIAVLGGDDRELILVSELVRMGATVVVAGFPRERVGHGAFVVNNIEDACKEAEVAILPLPGTSMEGVIRAVYSDQELKLTEKAVANLASNALIIIGSARQFLKDWAKKRGVTLLEIAEIDAVAILNSIPTAEGAIQIAMEETPSTIHGSKTCVIGFGRVGITLARTLKALGSDVTVVARDEGQLARAYEMGCRRAGFDDLHEIMNYSSIVFNTVPEMVLPRSILKYANPEILIIDLAAQPGGTDFEAANAYGLKAILAPGLPGKVAPVFAGKILAEVIPDLVIKELTKPDKNMLYG